MKIEHSYSKELDAILVKHSGVFSGFEAGSPMSFGIGRLAEVYSCNRFLLDARDMKCDRSIIDLYFMGEKFDKLGFKRKFQIAFVYSQDEELYEFLELVVQNRGYSTRFFKDETQALEWLMNGRS